jgi:hypothetical protein
MCSAVAKELTETAAGDRIRADVFSAARPRPQAEGLSLQWFAEFSETAGRFVRRWVPRPLARGFRQLVGDAATTKVLEIGTFASLSAESRCGGRPDTIRLWQIRS